MMKKFSKISSLLIMLLSMASVSAIAQNNRVYLSTEALEPGTEGTLGIALDNSDTYYGFSADVTLPRGLEFVKKADGKVDVSLNAERFGNTYLVVSNISGGKLLMGAFSSDPQQPINGISGDIAYIKVKVAQDFQKSELTLSNVKLINAADRDVPVTDNKSEIGVLPVSVALTPAEFSLNQTETQTLTPSFTTEHTTVKTLTWSSSDESVATVSQDGVVTAVYRGSATITATSINGKSAFSDVTVYIPAVGISLDRSEMTMERGSTETLIATPDPIDTTDEIIWSSSDESVATVEDGVVVATGIGNAVITARCGEYEAECNVTVIVTPTAMTLTNSKIFILEGKIAELGALIEPMDATDKSVVWTSDNETVATVDADGYVTAIVPGLAIITATSVANPTVMAQCYVTVVSDLIVVANISISDSQIEMYEDETYTLTATITPEDATDPTVTWTSSDTSIAEVSQDGVVTAKTPGKVIIYASSSNGLTVDCDVTVRPRTVDPDGISLSNYELVMREGHTTDLIAVVSPDDATDKTVVWTSADESVATVDQDGIVTAIKVGETTVTATTVNGLQANCLVTVIPDIIAVGEITLNPTELTIKESETFTLVATVTPEDATDKSVTWKSSDLSVATVSTDGIVTGVRAGTATIYASSSNGLTAECALTVTPGEISVTGISLSNTELVMRVGHTTDLIAIVRPDDATDKSVVWSSSDESIATVDQNGIVTAIELGETTITVTTANGLQANCFVTVIPDIVAVSDITLNRTELTIKESDTFTLIATITPEDATDKTVTWKSSDKNVVTVSDDGVVTGVRVGTATIYASSSNGLTAECLVTVTPGEIAVESISLSNTELLMREGHTAELIALIRPADATDQSVTWSSADESIATVDQNGLVTAIKQGVTTVTATSANGMSAQCVITVVPDAIAVEGISLNKTELTIKESESFTLIATITPDDADDKTVTWKSSDKEIATVSEDGVVTGVRVGTATIYASSSNGLTVECAVTVTPGEIAVTGISLSNTELLMRVGHTAELIALIRPADATDKTVTWSSDDESIATVDQTGIVTAIELGVTTVTATSANGMSAVCVVTVVPDFIAVEEITLNKETLQLTAGELFTLIATIKPEDATDKTVTWKSSDRAVATVSEDGEVTAVAVGTATIYASSSNGLTAECLVTVTPGEIAVTGISLSNTELLMREGHTAELLALIQPTDATDPTVIWSSDNESIATVDQNGIVTAVKQGFATVTATSSNGLTATCAVTVVPDFVAVTDVTLNRSELTLVEEDTFTLIATVSPDDATDKTVTWLSSNTAVATVSGEGVVTAVKAGSAVIFASSSNGITAICDVTVEPLYIDVSTIALEPTEVTILEGETISLTAIILPDNATDMTITWTSNNPTVASVEDGVVTGLSHGIATIMAKSSNGKTAYSAVTVKHRPMTPRQFLRKGDGTTCTFVILMDLSDAELAELGYRYVVGYTDANGRSTIIAETPLRYCHTTSEIYNNPTYDFWAFSVIVNDEGETMTSNLRHLDGSEELCLDPSKYGFDPDARGRSMGDGDDWITVSPTHLSIAVNSSADSQVAVYTTSGVRVYSKTYSESAPMTDEIELKQFVAGSYVVTLTSAGEVKAKKILVL